MENILKRLPHDIIKHEILEYILIIFLIDTKSSTIDDTILQYYMGYFNDDPNRKHFIIWKHFKLRARCDTINMLPLIRGIKSITLQGYKMGGHFFQIRSINQNNLVVHIQSRREVLPNTIREINLIKQIKLETLTLHNVHMDDAMETYMEYIDIRNLKTIQPFISNKVAVTMYRTYDDKWLPKYNSNVKNAVFRHNTKKYPSIYGIGYFHIDIFLRKNPNYKYVKPRSICDNNYIVQLDISNTDIDFKTCRSLKRLRLKNVNFNKCILQKNFPNLDILFIAKCECLKIESITLTRLCLDRIKGYFPYDLMTIPNLDRLSIALPYSPKHTIMCPDNLTFFRGSTMLPHSTIDLSTCIKLKQFVFNGRGKYTLPRRTESIQCIINNIGHTHRPKMTWPHGRLKWNVIK